MIHSQEDYKSKNDFTNFILESIEKEIIIDLNKCFWGYNLDFARINNSVKLIRFKLNILNTTIDEFIEILKGLPYEIKKQDLIQLIHKDNPDLFLKYILIEIKENLKYTYSISEKIDKLLDYYDGYFKDNLYKNEFYENIYKPLFDNDKIESVAYFLFMKFEKSDVENIMTNSFNEELKLIDIYFRDNSDKETEMKEFLKKYSEVITNKLPFLNSKKIKSKLIESVKNGNISLLDGSMKDEIDSLSKSDKFDVVVRYLIYESKINAFDLSYKKYLSFIEDLFDIEKMNFWKIFFNEKSLDNHEYYTLSYLKRMFIVSNINILEYKELILDLRSRCNSFEKEWLDDWDRNRL